MGYYARVTADPGLTEHDAARLLDDGLLRSTDPIHGFYQHDGQTLPFILDASNLAPERHKIVPEQIVIAALLLASFITPIYQLIG